VFIHIEKLHYEYIDKIHLVKKLSKADNIMTRMNLIYKHKYTLRLIIFLCSALLPLFSMQVVHADTNDIQDVVSQNKIATDDNNSTSTIMPLAATTAADPTDIASGTFNTCDWVIDANGKLTITKQEGMSSGMLGIVTVTNNVTTGLPWYDYLSQIKSVYIGENVMSSYNAANIFAKMPNVTTIDVSNLNVQFATDLGDMFSSDPKLTSIIGLGNWDLSKAERMSTMFSNDTLLSAVDGIGNWNMLNVTDIRSMFSSCKEINIKELSSWDTSNITSMASLFNNTNISDFSPVENWDVSKVTTMNSMFESNLSVTSLNLSNWRTSSLEGMSRMFSYCNNMTDIIGLDNFDLSNVKRIDYLFNSDTSLTSLSGLTNWDTSNVTDMTGVFWACRNLTGLDLSKWDTSNVTNMSYMFGSSTKLNEKNLYGLDKFNTSNVTNMSNMFSGTGFTDLDLNSFNTEKVTNMSNMFSNTSNLQKVLASFDTQSVTNMGGLFSNSAISDISQLNIADWDTSNVTTLSYTFSQCANLKQLPISTWNTSKVEDLSYTFYQDTSIEQLPISNWNTSNVTTLSYTFSQCANLKQLPISTWNTSKVESFFYTFYQDASIEQLPISNWDVSSATTMRGMFWGTGVKTLDVSTWNTSNVDTFYAMFNAMPNLETLDISNFDTTNATDVQAMLKNDTNLWKLTLGPKSVLTNLNGPALEQTASVPTPVPGTAIKDDSTDKTYSAISDKWQVVDTADGGTDHEPLGDLVSAQDIMDKFSTVGNPVTTYVWQQQTKGDMKMTVPDIDFGTTSNASGLVRRKNDFAINVTNSTYPTDAVPSDLYVSMDAPLTDETDKTKTLNDVLVFKDKYNNENVLSSADTKIYSGDIANGPNTISWDDDHGILLDMNHDRYAENGHYSTTLKWTLTNSL